ncbi:MAG: helix-turn-helix domain-containing protein [Actinomycetota bacterium]
MTRDPSVADSKPRKPAKPLPRKEEPEFYEGLGRAIKVARTAMGLGRKDLAEAAGVSYAYLSDIETGRGRPGSRSFLAIAEALELSPSELMREAEAYRAQITGEPMVDRAALAPEPEADLETMIQRYSEAAPSPAARRWFHAGRALAGAQLDEERGASETRLGSSAMDDAQRSSVQDELRGAIEELSSEDAAVVLALVRRLGRES